MLERELCCLEGIRVSVQALLQQLTMVNGVGCRGVETWQDYNPIRAHAESLEASGETSLLLSSLMRLARAGALRFDRSPYCAGIRAAVCRPLPVAFRRH